MKMKRTKTLQFFFLILVSLFATLSFSLPLSTSKRWIVDTASGQRVKLACVNWASHLQPMLAEGLDKNPVTDIAAAVVHRGFNCVRLTWSTFMFTRYANLTVAETFDSLGLEKAKKSVARNNPFVLNMTHVEAYEAVVSELGAHGVMVILDNHVSMPKWCCNYDDGNGFFGDSQFRPEEWLQGLVTVAQLFKDKIQVVGMSLRNELRGPRQNEHDWYKYILRGAREVHKANPNVLILLSGLSWGTDLSFLKTKSPESNFDNKLVYEAHWYSFSGDSKIWELQPLNRVCAKATQWFNDQNGFLISNENPFPLFLSEFGFDQRGEKQADNRFLTCLIAYVVERDLDWGLWALQGSYYYREGNFGAEETFGVLDFNWKHLRNPTFQKRFRLLQTMIQDSYSKKLPKSYILYHPQSGQCVQVNNKNELHMRDCKKWTKWSYGGDGTPVRLMGSTLCLKAVGYGLPPILSDDCLSQQSAWKIVSNSKLHLAALDGKGEEYLCLQVISSEILTRRCICIEDDSECQENPENQWFKLISSNVN